MVDPATTANLPFPCYYSGAYNDQAAYSPGALVVDSSHLYVCTVYLPELTGEATHTAPGSDTASWDLLL